MYETRKCEHCGKAMNSRLTVCPFCSGEVLSDQTQYASPFCPRCSKPLEQRIVRNEEYDICPECGGMWLDRGEFHRANRESDVYTKDNLDKSHFHPPLPGTIAYIPCVRCRKIMNRKNFARISGVILDECSKHGVWLDAGELDKIRLFIADGGLERAQDKEIEKNRLEIASLASKVDQTAFTLKLLHFWNFKRWLFG